MSFDPKTAKPINGFDPSTAKPFEELPPDTTEGIVTSKKEVKPPIFEPIKNPFGEITGQAKPGRFDNYIQDQIGEEPTTASQVDPLYNANKFFAKATEDYTNKANNAYLQLTGNPAAKEKVLAFNPEMPENVTTEPRTNAGDIAYRLGSFAEPVDKLVSGGFERLSALTKEGAAKIAEGLQQADTPIKMRKIQDQNKLQKVVSPFNNPNTLRALGNFGVGLFDLAMSASGLVQAYNLVSPEARDAITATAENTGLDKELVGTVFDIAAPFVFGRKPGVFINTVNQVQPVVQEKLKELGFPDKDAELGAGVAGMITFLGGEVAAKKGGEALKKSWEKFTDLNGIVPEPTIKGSPLDPAERIKPEGELTRKQQSVMNAYEKTNGRNANEKAMIENMVSKFAPTLGEVLDAKPKTPFEKVTQKPEVSPEEQAKADQQKYQELQAKQKADYAKEKLLKQTPKSNFRPVENQPEEPTDVQHIREELLTAKVPVMDIVSMNEEQLRAKWREVAGVKKPQTPFEKLTSKQEKPIVEKTQTPSQIATEPTKDLAPAVPPIESGKSEGNLGGTAHEAMEGRLKAKEETEKVYDDTSMSSQKVEGLLGEPQNSLIPSTTKKNLAATKPTTPDNNRTASFRMFSQGKNDIEVRKALNLPNSKKSMDLVRSWREEHKQEKIERLKDDLLVSRDRYNSAEGSAKTKERKPLLDNIARLRAQGVDAKFDNGKITIDGKPLRRKAVMPDKVDINTVEVRPEAGKRFEELSPEIRDRQKILAENFVPADDLPTGSGEVVLKKGIEQIKNDNGEELKPEAKIVRDAAEDILQNGKEIQPVAGGRGTREHLSPEQIQEFIDEKIERKGLEDDGLSEAAKKAFNDANKDDSDLLFQNDEDFPDRTELQRAYDRKKHLELATKQLREIANKPTVKGGFYEHRNIWDDIIRGEQELKNINKQIIALEAKQEKAPKSQLDMFGKEQKPQEPKKPPKVDAQISSSRPSVGAEKVQSEPDFVKKEPSGQEIKLREIINEQAKKQTEYTSKLAEESPDVIEKKQELAKEFGFEKELNIGDFSKPDNIEELLKNSGFKILVDKELKTNTFMGGVAREIIAEHPTRGMKYIYELPERGDIDSFNNNYLVTTKPLTEKQYQKLLYEATGRRNALSEQEYEDNYKTPEGEMVKWIEQDRESNEVTVEYPNGEQGVFKPSELTKVKTLPQINEDALKKARGGNFAAAPDSRDVHSIYKMLDPMNPTGTSRKISKVLFDITKGNTKDTKDKFLQAVSERITDTFKSSETEAEIKHIVSQNIDRYSQWFDAMSGDILTAVNKIKSHPDYPELSSQSTRAPKDEPLSLFMQQGEKGSRADLEATAQMYKQEFAKLGLDVEIFTDQKSYDDALGRHNIRFQTPKAMVETFKSGRFKIYLSERADAVSLNHEILTHIALTQVEKNNPGLYAEGLTLAKQNPEIIKALAPKYPKLYQEYLNGNEKRFLEEVIANANETDATEAIRAKVDKNVWAKFWAWVKAVRLKMKLALMKMFKMQSSQRENITDFNNRVKDKFFGGDKDITGGRKAEPGLRMQNDDQTKTKEFKKWFGESKVVDAKGEPLAVYHGTDKNFDSFDMKNKIGIHLGTAEQADDRMIRKSIKPNAKEFYTAGTNIMPSYATLRNPLRTDELAWENPDKLIDGLSELGILNDKFWDAHDKNITGDDKFKPIREGLKAIGYDGIVYKNQFEGEKEADSFIAFEPTQIKSATGNKGTFDAENPDIRMQNDLAPEVRKELEDYKAKLLKQEQTDLVKRKIAGVDKALKMADIKPIVGEEEQTLPGYNERTMNQGIKDELIKEIESRREWFNQHRRERVTNKQTEERALEIAETLNDSDILKLNPGEIREAAETFAYNAYAQRRFKDALDNRESATTEEEKIISTRDMLRAGELVMRARALYTEAGRTVQAASIKNDDELLRKINLSKEYANAIDPKLGRELSDMLGELNYDLNKGQLKALEEAKKELDELIKTFNEKTNGKSKRAIDLDESKQLINKIIGDEKVDFTPSNVKKLRHAKKAIKGEEAKKALTDIIDANDKNPNIWNKLDFWFYNSILSNPLTDVANVSGNMFNAAAEIMPMMATANSAQRAAIIRGFKQGVRLGKTESSKIYHAHGEASKFEEIAMMEKRYDIHPKTSTGRALRTFLPTTRLALEDAMFRSIAREMYLEYGKATAGKKLGMSLDEINKAMELLKLDSKGEGDLLEDSSLPSDKVEDIGNIQKDADELARYAVFQSELGKTGKTIQALQQSNRLIKYFVLAFVKTPINLLNVGYNYSPFGFANLREGKTKNMSPQMKKQYKRRAYAGSLFYAGLGLGMAAGFVQVTGQLGKDKDKKDMMMRMGFKQNHIYLKGWDGNWYGVSYQAISPFAPLLAIIGNLSDEFKLGGDFDNPDKNVFEKIGEGVLGAAGTITDQSYLQGLSNVLQAVTRRDGKYFQRLIANPLVPSGATIPKNVSQYASGEKPTYRVKGVLDIMKNKVGLTKDLTPNIDVLGEQRVSGYERLPFWVTRAKSKPLEQFLLDKGINIPEAGRSTKINDRIMTDKELARYQEMSGMGIAARLKEELPNLKKLNVSDAQDRVDDIVREERKKAKKLLGDNGGKSSSSNGFKVKLPDFKVKLF